MPELGENAIRKLCDLERNSRFSNTPIPDKNSQTLARSPLAVYVITDSSGEFDVADPDSVALKPCSDAYAIRTHFSNNSDGITGCYKIDAIGANAERVFDPFGLALVLPGHPVWVCRNPFNGRLETCTEAGLIRTARFVGPGALSNTYRFQILNNLAGSGVFVEGIVVGTPPASTDEIYTVRFNKGLDPTVYWADCSTGKNCNWIACLCGEMAEPPQPVNLSCCLPDCEPFLSGNNPPITETDPFPLSPPFGLADGHVSSGLFNVVTSPTELSVSSTGSPANPQQAFSATTVQHTAIPLCGIESALFEVTATNNGEPTFSLSQQTSGMFRMMGMSFSIATVGGPSYSIQERIDANNSGPSYTQFSTVTANGNTTNVAKGANVRFGIQMTRIGGASNSNDFDFETFVDGVSQGTVSSTGMPCKTRIAWRIEHTYSADAGNQTPFFNPGQPDMRFSEFAVSDLVWGSC